MKKKQMPEGESSLVAVKFLRYDAPFSVGDVRLFPRATADKLVTAGVAEYVDAGVEA